MLQFTRLHAVSVDSNQRKHCLYPCITCRFTDLLWSIISDVCVATCLLAPGYTNLIGLPNHSQQIVHQNNVLKHVNGLCPNKTLSSRNCVWVRVRVRCSTLRQTIRQHDFNWLCFVSCLRGWTRYHWFCVFFMLIVPFSCLDLAATKQT